ncbi:energy transducer TonB [Hymenobacter sp. PAMC 26628]|uniref:energy transducer TonB n=1 Tax=Hymenobacter sp. PAMC 26628 TaxID=1484118 RepID=UPI0007700701|nr:energy transducer TonB [Hymenobacter sp. PAMC 26628]AMJ64114.1 hypothetical protein AXW84_00705 [Hymenobacter sp. PAMC 26628]
MLLLPTFHARLLPCSESWAAMTPMAQGRHCARCQRVVLDLTQSQNPAADLAAARAAASDGRVCGRFAGAQVQGPPPLTRRLRWFLVALVLVVAQGLSAREALAQVRRGAPHHKAKVIKPVKQIHVLEDIQEQTVCTSGIVMSDDEGPVSNAQGPYTYVEQMPTYKGGGTAAIVAHIQQNVHFRNGFAEDFTGRRVFVQFVIDTTGRAMNPVIVKGLEKDIDEEVLRVVRDMAGFTPGRQSGWPVDVVLTVPIIFPEPKPSTP